MNTKIKFRIWDIEYKDWVKDDCVVIDATGRILTYRTRGAIGRWIQDKNKDFVVQQFINMKDKNEKDIYEGDIVKIGRRKEVVEWSDWRTGFMPFVDWDEYERGGLNWDAEKCEVIGNIFENS